MLYGLATGSVHKTDSLNTDIGYVPRTILLENTVKHVISALVLVLAAGSALASTTPVTANATTETLEMSVEGLNCALCSEALRSKMKAAAGAKDIEPRLECGRVYLEVPRGKQLNEAAMTFLLSANGFNLKGIKPADKSIPQVRKLASDAC